MAESCVSSTTTMAMPFFSSNSPCSTCRNLFDGTDENVCILVEEQGQKSRTTTTHHTLHTTAEERIVDKNKLIGMIHTNEIGFYSVNNVITYRWGKRYLFSCEATTLRLVRFLFFFLGCPQNDNRMPRMFVLCFVFTNRWWIACTFASLQLCEKEIENAIPIANSFLFCSFRRTKPK